MAGFRRIGGEVLGEKMGSGHIKGASHPSFYTDINRECKLIQFRGSEILISSIILCRRKSGLPSLTFMWGQLRDQMNLSGYSKWMAHFQWSLDPGGVTIATLLWTSIVVPFLEVLIPKCGVGFGAVVLLQNWETSYGGPSVMLAPPNSTFIGVGALHPLFAPFVQNVMRQLSIFCSSACGHLGCGRTVPCISTLIEVLSQLWVDGCARLSIKIWAVRWTSTVLCPIWSLRVGIFRGPDVKQFSTRYIILLSKLFGILSLPENLLW